MRFLPPCKTMRVSVLAAQRREERRVALTPDSAHRLIGSGHNVSIEAGAGAGAGFPDDSYREAGASIGNPDETDVMVCVEPPEPGRVAGTQAVLGLLEPLDDHDHLHKLASTGVSLLAFELVPRTTRAQTVDALSSQATIAGYAAVIEAAGLSDRIFPMLTTAAGTIRPAGVVVLGAGVAGLQAIATARRLGAVVSAFDVRAAAAEQVRSLGARFIEVNIEAQDSSGSGGYASQLAENMEAAVLAGLFEPVTKADVVVTTAAIPGRPAPRLVSSEMVAAMRPGAVIVDGVASTGGNCEVTTPGETVTHHGVVVSGPLDLPSRAANHASLLYGRNVANFIGFMSGDNAEFHLDMDDEVVASTLAATHGEIVNPRVLDALAPEE